MSLSESFILYKKKDASARQFSGTCYEESSASSRSGEKIRLEIQFHQSKKIVSVLIQSDIHFQMTENEGIRKTYDPQNQDITKPETFFPIAKNPTKLAALELLKQPKGMYPS